MDWFNIFAGDKPSAVMTGAAGGVVRWVTLRENWRDGLASLVVGAICALYLGPLVEPLLEPMIGDISPNGDAGGFASFIVGLGGVSISGLIIDALRLRRSQVGGGK